MQVKSRHPDNTSILEEMEVFFSSQPDFETLQKQPSMNYPFRLSKLYDYGGDVSRRWVMVYYAYNVATGKLQRCKDYSMNQHKTLRERRRYCAWLGQSIDYNLMQGYFIDPERKVKEVEALPKVLTLDKAFEYIYQIKLTTNRPQSAKEWQTLKTVFVAWAAKKGLANKHIATLTSFELMPFFDYLKLERKVNNKTYNNYVLRVNTFFNALVARQLMKYNPLKGIKKLPEEEKQHVPYSLEEIQIIKELLGEHPTLWLAVQFIYYCFVRPNELRQLRVQHIQGKILYIPPEIAKTRKARYVPIHPSLWDQLIAQGIHQRGQRAFILSKDEKGNFGFGERALYAKYKYLLRKVLQPGHDLYGWKHSGVIAAYNHSRDIKAIQSYCGHVSISETDIYLKKLGLIRPQNLLDSTPAI